MANTLIQLKRSSANAVPSLLSAAEPAYSYVSDKLFLGTSDGSGVIAIGGKYFVDQQNTIFNAANSYAAGTNAWTNTVVAGANAWTNTSVSNAGAAANAYTDTLVAAANAWTNSSVAGANAYTNTVIAAANAWTNASVAGANAYTDTVVAAANAWANTVGSNAGAGANAYANATFFKLTGGTINGDVNISGNLTLTGNTVFNNVSTYIVDDPLIYLAGNNYTSDVVDIGFVANYNNGACSTVHTGLFRDSGNPNKEWYLFEGYDREPENNQIDPNGNNFTISVLNATLRTSNVILNGVNLWSWINTAYTQANAAPDIANSYADIVVAGANGWVNTSVAGANAWTNAAVAGANAWSNTKVSSVGGTAGEIYSSGGTTPTLNLIATGVSADTYGGSSGLNAVVPVFTVDAKGRITFASNVTVSGMDYAYVNTATAGANAWANTVGSNAGAGANSYALGLVSNINGANITSGVVAVSYGGTGNTTFTTNGVLFGNGSGPIQVTAAGTDGQVLISQGGVPQFSMLDGGSF